MTEVFKSPIKEECTSVKEKINSILTDVYQDLKLGLPMKIPILAASSDILYFNSKTGVLAYPTESRKIRYLDFPKLSERENKRFVIYLRLLATIHDLLRAGIVTTKRDLYYRDVNLFQSQSVVDDAISQIAYSFGVERLHLNVVASPKGCVYGDLTITTQDGRILEIDRANGESLVPVDCHIDCIRPKSKLNAILVVEKEAVFRQLCQSLTDIVIVTGKGFPDVATRKFLRGLATCLADIPVYGLVDSDPHGILIFMTYKFGSRKNAYYNHLLAVPRMQYLGVSLSDYSQGWTTLSSKDITQTVNLLHESWITRPEFDCLRRELQLGMFLQKKAEMNIATRDSSRGFIEYVTNRLGKIQK